MLCNYIEAGSGGGSDRFGVKVIKDLGAVT